MIKNNQKEIMIDHGKYLKKVKIKNKIKKENMKVIFYIVYIQKEKVQIHR